MAVDSTTGLRGRKKQRTTHEIVSAARGLFAELGYSGTTISGIADAAGVSPGTVFGYFPTKDDLLFHDYPRPSTVEAYAEWMESRPSSQSAIDRAHEWMVVRLPEWHATELRTIMPSEREWARVRRRILDADPMLLGKEQTRWMETERIFAEAVASDLGDPVGGLRPRLVAAAAIGAHLAIIRHGYEHIDEHSSENSPYALYAYATAFLQGGLDAMLRLPPPPG